VIFATKNFLNVKTICNIFLCLKVTVSKLQKFFTALCSHSHEIQKQALSKTAIVNLVLGYWMIWYQLLLLIKKCRPESLSLC